MSNKERWHAEPTQKTTPAWFTPDGVRTERYGLSIWDHFAAAALSGALANPKITDDANASDHAAVPRGYASIAADMADAMMAERDKRKASC